MKKVHFDLRTSVSRPISSYEIQLVWQLFDHSRMCGTPMRCRKCRDTAHAVLRSLQIFRGRIKSSKGEDIEIPEYISSERWVLDVVKCAGRILDVAYEARTSRRARTYPRSSTVVYRRTTYRRPGRKI